MSLKILRKIFYSHDRLGQSKVTYNIIDELFKMDGGTRLKKIQFIQSCKGKIFLKSHDRLSPDGTRYVKKENVSVLQIQIIIPVSVTWTRPQIVAIKQIFGEKNALLYRVNIVKGDHRFLESMPEKFLLTQSRSTIIMITRLYVFTFGDMHWFYNHHHYPRNRIGSNYCLICAQREKNYTIKSSMMLYIQLPNQSRRL